MMSILTNEKGTAMTEAVIVIPFFIIVWMSFIALHHIYDGRLEAQVIALGTALATSYGGCDGNSAVGVEEGVDVELPEKASSWLSDLGVETPFGCPHTNGRVTLSVSGVPALYDGPEVDVKAKQRVACNMRPKDGLSELVLGILGIGN